MQPDDKRNEAPKLDSRKLLGFRNLAQVKGRDGDARENSDLAFTKRGEGGGC
jgi:hypothetical protein